MFLAADASSQERRDYFEVAHYGLGAAVMKSCSVVNSLTRQSQCFLSLSGGLIHCLDTTSASFTFSIYISDYPCTTSITAMCTWKEEESGNDVLVVGRGSRIDIWSGKDTLRSSLELGHPVQSLASHQDLLAVSSGSLVHLIHNREGLLCTFQLGTSVQSVSLNASGLLLALTSNELRVWEREHDKQKAVLHLQNSTALFFCAVLGPRKRIFLGCMDGNCMVMDVSSPSSHQLFGHSKVVRSVQISQDECRGVSSSWDCSIRIWDLNNLTCLQVLSNIHAQYVTSVSWLGSSETFVCSTSSDKSYKVIDLYRSDRERLVLLLALLKSDLCGDVLHVVKTMLFGTFSNQAKIQ